MLQTDFDTLDTDERGLTLWFLTDDEVQIIEKIERLTYRTRGAVLKIIDLLIEFQEG